MYSNNNNNTNMSQLCGLVVTQCFPQTSEKGQMLRLQTRRAPKRRALRSVLTIQIQKALNWGSQIPELLHCLFRIPFRKEYPFEKNTLFRIPFRKEFPFENTCRITPEYPFEKLKPPRGRAQFLRSN